MNARLKRWLVILIVLVAVITGVVITLKQWMNSSSSGSVQVGSSSSPATNSGPITIDTQYFSTQLPAGFTERRRTETPQATQTLLQLVATGGENKQQDFAATVGLLPSEGMTGVGDYNLRRSQTSSYQQTELPSQPAGSVAFRATQGAPALVLFMTQSNHYLEFSFSSGGGATADQLQTLYLQVIGSLLTK